MVEKFGKKDAKNVNFSKQMECRKKSNGYVMHRKLFVGVERLRVLCIIGILPEERLIPQPLLISLTTRVKDPDAFLDYSALANMAMQLAKESHFFLLEEYASALCHTILQNPLIDTLKVRIEKPGAITSAQSAFIEMEASRCTGH